MWLTTGTRWLGITTTCIPFFRVNVSGLNTWAAADRASPEERPTARLPKTRPRKPFHQASERFRRCSGYGAPSSRIRSIGQDPPGEPCTSFGMTVSKWPAIPFGRKASTISSEGGRPPSRWSTSENIVQQALVVMDDLRTATPWPACPAPHSAADAWLPGGIEGLAGDGLSCQKRILSAKASSTSIRADVSSSTLRRMSDRPCRRPPSSGSPARPGCDRC